MLRLPLAEDETLVEDPWLLKLLLEEDVMLEDDEELCELPRLLLEEDVMLEDDEKLDGPLLVVPMV